MSRYPIKALKSLEAVVRCGGVKAAAADLHVTPGAISQQIRKLEDDLGQELFDRSARAMHATPEAMELGAELTLAFGAIDAAVDRIQGQRNNQPLRVSALPSIATRIVVPALGSFRAHAPSVRLSFSYVHRVSDFSLSNADVLLCVVDGDYRGEGAVYDLLEGSVRPVASPDFITRHGPFHRPADLLDAPLIHDWDTAAWRQWFARVGIHVPGSLPGDIYEDFGLVAYAALTGQGIALCPQDLVRRELENGDLEFVSTVSVLNERRYCVVVPEVPRPDAEIFVNWIIELTSRNAG
ncbi:MAG: LysR substrate-binding domain-containing protein [Pseudomonadota bacterium]